MAGRTISIASLALLLVATTPVLAQRDPWRWVHRYHFDIDAKTPLKELLPTPPKIVPVNQLLVNDLALVPEVQFEEPYVFKADSKNQKELDTARQRALIHIAHQVAKINFLNQAKTDHFMERLVENRPDLAGLPFTLGEACRLKADDREYFRDEVRFLRFRLGAHRHHEVRVGAKDDRPRPTQNCDMDFWAGFDEDRRRPSLAAAVAGFLHETTRPIDDRWAVAALMQMLGPESSLYHPGLIERLERFEQSPSAKELSVQALARLAVFSPEKTTRDAAIAVLMRQDSAAANAIFLHGMRYPWPSVAQNAMDAIVQLKRGELIPELVAMLDEADPRTPSHKVIAGKKVPVVREVVRINHHRNCLLCHPPGNTPEIFGPVRDKSDSPDVAGVQGVRAEHVGLQFLKVGADMAPVPLPGTPFPKPSEGYGRFDNPDILVRADATYLRQDFSLLQQVANADPWPEMQRFDFLVRTRVLTEHEAEAYRAEFTGAASPYRQAALSALRRLTGQDAGITARDWRIALDLP